MVAKNVVIPLETEYLQRAAKARGVSRTMLVKLIMQRVIAAELVPAILGEDRLEVPVVKKYRRFKVNGDG